MIDVTGTNSEITIQQNNKRDIETFCEHISRCDLSGTEVCSNCPVYMFQGKYNEERTITRLGQYLKKCGLNIIFKQS